MAVIMRKTGVKNIEGKEEPRKEGKIVMALLGVWGIGAGTVIW